MMKAKTQSGDLEEFVFRHHSEEGAQVTPYHTKGVEFDGGIRATGGALALLTAAALALLGGCLAAHAAGNVKFYYETSSQAPAVSNSISVFYLGAPSAFNLTNIITRDRSKLTTDTNGYALLTNYVPGIYRSELQGKYSVTTNWYNFPVTNGTIYAADPAWSVVETNAFSSSTVAYSQAAVDALFIGIDTFTNVLFVSKSGSDVTGSRAGQPFLSISNAVAAALPGDLVWVQPGTYFEHNLLKNQVNFRFETGARVVWITPDSTAAAGIGLFDDRGTGATTNQILGALDFYYSCGTNDSTTIINTNAVGAVVTTNPATRLFLQMHNADGDSFSVDSLALVNGFSADPALFYISRAGRVEIICNEVLNSRVYDTVSGVGSVLCGMYWELGETYFTFSHLAPSLVYGIWPNEPNPQGANVGNLWVNGGLCEGYIYSSGISPNWRSWFNFQELRVTNAVGPAFAPYGGKAYLVADKISTLNANAHCIDVEQGCEAWITAQKIVAPAGGGWVKTANSTNYVTCMHYEAPATTALSANGGFWATGGEMYLNGGDAKCNGLGLLENGGKVYAKNLTLCTTNANLAGNYAVTVNNSGNVSLQGCKLVVPALCLSSINAGSAKNIGVYWSAANVGKSSNITLSPNGGFTIDSNVR